MVESGTVVDPAMIYFDARLSERFPAVEVRVADVCLRVEDTVLLAALTRALVDTAARAWAAGRDAGPVRVELLRLASWRAGRSGLDGDLLDPRSHRPAPARRVLDLLLTHVREALCQRDEHAMVGELLGMVLRRGNGATRQRATYRRTGKFADVVADAVRLGRR
jgi:carboxylate-amine ligase